MNIDMGDKEMAKNESVDLQFAFPRFVYLPAHRLHL